LNWPRLPILGAPAEVGWLRSAAGSRLAGLRPPARLRASAWPEGRQTRHARRPRSPA